MGYVWAAIIGVFIYRKREPIIEFFKDVGRRMRK